MLSLSMAATTYTGLAPMSRPAVQPTMKLADDGILGVGVIGAGRIGLVHLEALSQCENAR